MTLPAPMASLPCPMCGTINRIFRLRSTHSFGSPDLDLRPPPDLGRLLSYSVETCDACGYAASSLDGPPKAAARAAMASPEWKALMATSSLPDLAAAFKRAEWIARQNRDLQEAIWMALRAAWVCDDENPAAAPTMRREAVALVRELVAEGGMFIHERGGHEALISDLLRRAGDWEQAATWAEQGLAVVDNEVVSAVLRLEVLLIAARDGLVHQVQEATEAPGEGDGDQDL